MKNSKPISSFVSCSDAELVVAACASEKKAFVEIVSRYQSLVTGVTLAILRDFSISEDAAQDAFVSAWQKIGTLKEPEKLRPWLTQISRNTALNYLKKRRPEDSLEASTSSFIDGKPRPDELAASREEEAAVLSALDALPEKYRLPLVLYYREDQSVDLVAKALSQSEVTVRKQLSRGRAMLRGKVAGLFENVVTRTTPGTVFTATIAGLIGAMLKPTAVAATAFSAKPIVTTMTISKLTLTTVALITAVAIPAGYTAKMVFEDSVGGIAKTETISPVEFHSSHLLAESEIVKEWKRLWERYSGRPGDLPELFAEIDAMPEGLRRRGFHALLASEWAKVDPQGGRVFYASGSELVKRSELRFQEFYESWIREDQEAALIAIVEEKNLLVDFILKVLAEYRPESLPGYWKENFGDDDYSDFMVEAFRMVASKSPKKAAVLAEQVTGESRQFALQGAARGWGEIDSQAAMKWVKSLTDATERRDATDAVLEGWQHEDPFGALDEIAQDRERFWKGNNIVDLALQRAVDIDLTGAMRWARDHQHSDSFDVFKEHLSTRLEEKPREFLDHLEKEQLLTAMKDVVFPERSGAAANEETETVMWDWLFDPERPDDILFARERFLQNASYRFPRPAMAAVEKIPAGEGRDELMRTVSYKFFRSGLKNDGLDDLLRTFSSDWRRALVNAAVQVLPAGEFTDRAKWEERRRYLDERNTPNLDKKLKEAAE